jgi:hypothetical protein
LEQCLREFVMGTCHMYDWVQIGAAVKHPEHGKIINISEDIKKQTGVADASVKVYAHTGYGRSASLARNNEC